jgi:putative ABC transport system permease protein
MRFFQFVYKNVLRRKFRSLLTGVGVAVAITAVVALLGVSSGFEQSSREMLSAEGIDLIVVHAGLGQHDTSRLDESVGAQIAALSEVDKVAPQLNDTVKLNDNPVGVPLMGLYADSFNMTKLTDKVAAGGRMLTANDKDGVLLGKFLAASLGKKPGDSVEIELKKFNVVGIFAGPSMFENRAAVALLPVLQTLMDQEHQVSEFDIKLKPEFSGDAAALDRLKTKIAGLKDAKGNLYHLEPLTTDQYVSSSNELRLSRAMAWMTSAIALAIGAVGMLNTMIMSVLERTQEIGILRAIGWRRLRIMRMILSESFVLSLAGAVAGIVGAVCLTRIISHLPQAEGLVRPNIAPDVIFTGFLLALLVGLVGGAYPAIRGANLAPTEALRYE